MIETIIFDFGGVIVNHTDPTTFEYVSKRFNIEYEAVASTINELLVEYHKGKISDKEFWIRFSKKVGKDLPSDYEKFWKETYISEVRRTPGVEEIITRLRKDGYKLGILSNTIPPHVKHNRKMQYYDGFDVVILSCEVGMQKPDQEIYELTTKKLGTDPQNCVFIDNLQENLEPARDIGMKTILFESAQQLKEDLIKLGVRLE